MKSPHTFSLNLVHKGPNVLDRTVLVPVYYILSPLSSQLNLYDHKIYSLQWLSDIKTIILRPSVRANLQTKPMTCVFFFEVVFFFLLLSLFVSHLHIGEDPSRSPYGSTFIIDVCKYAKRV